MPYRADPRRNSNHCLERLKRIGLATALVMAAVALSGCESVMVFTGLRMRLDGVPLQSIAATLPGNGGLSPGASARLSIVATTVDGRSLATVGTGQGKVLGDSYAYEADIVSVDEDGVVKLPEDPRVSEGRTPHVRIRAIGQEAPVGDIDIPVRYDVAFKTSFAGQDGMPGFDGLAGMDGSNGSPGSIDPAAPAPGGNGGNGGNGMSGDNGGDGSAGPDVDVRVALAPGERPLLRVRASAAGTYHFFIVDPDGGSLSLAVRGGEGGRAGSGGRGGRGGSGGTGNPSGGSGSDGMAGPDGWPGRGGPAGRVHVTIDPAAAAGSTACTSRTRTATATQGPAPEVTIAPVPAPW